MNDTKNNKNTAQPDITDGMRVTVAQGGAAESNTPRRELGSVTNSDKCQAPAARDLADAAKTERGGDDGVIDPISHREAGNATFWKGLIPPT